MHDRPYMSIGDVLALLREEFPDITISKIRFLESRGLLVPERTPSGYRKFYDHDVERLRWILRQQREHFLPLKVIKGRLEGSEPGSERQPLFDVATGGAAGRDESPRGRAGNGSHAALEHVGGPAERLLLETAAHGPSVQGAGQHPSHLPPVPARTSGGAASEKDDARDAAAVTRRAAGAVAAGAVATGAVRTGAVAAGGGVTGAVAAAGVATGAAAAGGGVTGAVAAAGVATGAAAGGMTPGAAAGAGTARATYRPREVGADRLPDTPADGEGVHDPGVAGSGDEAGPGPVGAPHRSDVAETGGGASRAGAGGEGARVGDTASARAAPSSRRRSSRTGDGADMTATELSQMSGLSVEAVGELESFGLIEGHTVAGVHCYDKEALEVASLAAEFARFGIEARHLRIFKHAAERQSGLYSQVVLPILRQRNPEARRRAVDDLGRLSELGAGLQACFVREALRDVTGG